MSQGNVIDFWGGIDPDASEARLREMQRENKIIEGRMMEDFTNLFFGTELGQRVFKDMLDISDYFSSMFIGNSFVHYREGQKSFVSLVIKAAGLDTPEGMVLLQRLNILHSKQRGETNG